jgi:hypothetical protein
MNPGEARLRQAPGAVVAVRAELTSGFLAGLIVLPLRDTGLRVRPDQLILPGVLLLLYALQLATAIELGGAPRAWGNLSSLGGLCIGFSGFAIARAWAPAGARNSSLLATVAEMAGRPGEPDAIPAHSGEAGEAGAPPDRGNRD